MSDSPTNSFSAAVVTVSDKGARGEREDLSGSALQQLLISCGAEPVFRRIVPDERKSIRAALEFYSDKDRVDLIITTGGTGISPRDITPEATLELIDREVPGIAEAIRAQSLKITPRAMLSRAACGIRGTTLIINFPGSPKACQESFDAVRPVLTHALDVLNGRSGDCAR